MVFAQYPITRAMPPHSMPRSSQALPGGNPPSRANSPNHRDPFDRLLIAQAEIEALTLVTRDPVFDRYAVERIEA